MDFEKLIETKAKEILDQDDYYQHCLIDKEGFNSVMEKYQKEFKEVFHGNDILREQYGFMHYADILTFKIKKYPAEKEWLEKKMAKAIFGKKRLAEKLKDLEEKNEYADKIIMLRKNAEIAEQNYEIRGLNKKIKDHEKEAVRIVLIDNRNVEVVEDAFMYSIRKDGCTNRGRYSKGLVSYAYDMIDDEVQKMLKKTKYKEKLDDLKNQLAGNSSDDEDEKE